MHLPTSVFPLVLISFSFTAFATPIAGPSPDDLNEYLKTLGGITFNAGNDANDAAQTSGDIAYNLGKVGESALGKGGS